MADLRESPFDKDTIAPETSQVADDKEGAIQAVRKMLGLEDAPSAPIVRTPPNVGPEIGLPPFPASEPRRDTTEAVADKTPTAAAPTPDDAVHGSGRESASVRMRIPGVPTVTAGPATRTDTSRTDNYMKQQEQKLQELSSMPKTDRTAYQNTLAAAKSKYQDDYQGIEDKSLRQDLLNAFGKLTAGIVGLASLQDKNSYGLNMSGIQFDAKDYQKLKDDLWKKYTSDVADIKEDQALKERDRSQELEQRSAELHGLQGLTQSSQNADQLRQQADEGERNRRNAMAIAQLNAGTTLQAAAMRAGAAGGSREDKEKLAILKDMADQQKRAQGERDKAVEKFSAIGASLGQKDQSKDYDPDAIVESLKAYAVQSGVPPQRVQAALSGDAKIKGVFGGAPMTGPAYDLNKVYDNLTKEIEVYKQGTYFAATPDGKVVTVPKAKFPAHVLTQQGMTAVGDGDYRPLPWLMPDNTQPKARGK